MNGNATTATLPADIAIGTVVLQVADIDRSLAYYTRLGFTVIGLHDGDGSRTAQLGVQDDGHVLLELREKRGVKPVPRRGRLGLYHFAVLLPSRADLGRFLQHIAAHGVHAGASDHGVSEALYLTDPDGITMEVYRDRPRSEWRVRNGALEMYTLPLDGEAVMAAATDTEWSGVPAGTRMGHMHFYVGDVALARTFYVDGLGFEPMAQIPGALFAAAGGYHHHIGVNTWAAGQPIASDEDAKLLHWDLVLPTDEARHDAITRLRRAGYAITNVEGVDAASDPWAINVRLLAR